MSYTGILASNSQVSKEAREFYELKQRAAEYYRTNEIPQRIEEVLNSMFYEKPDDIYGYLVNYFSKFLKAPIISRLVGRKELDGKGQLTVGAEVFCIIKNKEKCVSSGIISGQLENNALPESREANDEARKESVNVALDWINESLSSLFKGLTPDNQHEADKLLRYLPVPLLPAIGQPKEKKGSGRGKKSTTPEKKIPPEEPPEPAIQGCTAIGAVSLAVAKTAAKLKKIPLYFYIASLKHQEVINPSNFSMPWPMVTLMDCGKSSPGKLNLMKEVIVVPKPGLKLKQSINMIQDLQNQIIKLLNLMSKTGTAIKSVSENGCLVLGFDRWEQPLDLIQEACKNEGIVLGEDMYVAINCNAHELMDYKRGKYEVITGTFKSPDEIVGLYVDFLNRYPSVIALFDPLRKEDIEQWGKLCSAVSPKCYLIAEAAAKTVSKLLASNDLRNPLSSGPVLKQTNETTVSDLIEITKLLEDHKYVTVIGTSGVEVCDDSIIDMAVGLEVCFVKLGGLSRGERVTKYNRLLAIEEELAQRGTLGQGQAYDFPVLTEDLQNIPESENP
nr:PREDICTED: enolase-like protein ENO4 [Latimeria chalumnae]|eukprot:XP_005995799.1 PREDICTED: enolase-like protein ENO4 [Latimeria chalumnae]